MEVNIFWNLSKINLWVAIKLRKKTPTLRNATKDGSKARGFIERIPSSIDGNQINFFIGFCVTLKHIFALMRQFLASSSIAGFKVLNRQIG